MSYSRASAAAMLMMATLGAVGLLRADEVKAKTHTLPKEAGAPVIVLDTTGGMIMRANNEPALTVTADGKVVVGNPYGGEKVEGKISAEELQTLLRFILDDEKLADIKPADLQMHGRVAVGDASTTHLTVEADGATHDLSARAIEMVAAGAGADSPAARFMAIVNRLNHLVNVTRLGGAEAAAKIAQTASAVLAAKYPEDGKVSVEDLQRAEALPNGATRAYFDKTVTLADGKWHRVAITVDQPATGKATTKVQRGTDQPPVQNNKGPR